MEASGIVLVTQRLSDDALYHELAADPGLLEKWGIVGLYRIGDCVAPRIPADAIFDGHRLGREIDSPTPATPLPYRRERFAVARANPPLTPPGATDLAPAAFGAESTHDR